MCRGTHTCPCARAHTHLCVCTHTCSHARTAQTVSIVVLLLSEGQAIFDGPGHERFVYEVLRHAHIHTCTHARTHARTAHPLADQLAAKRHPSTCQHRRHLCACVHTCLHACVHGYVHAACMCARVRVYGYVHACVCACVHACVWLLSERCFGLVYVVLHCLVLLKSLKCGSAVSCHAVYTETCTCRHTRTHTCACVCVQPAAAGLQEGVRWIDRHARTTHACIHAHCTCDCALGILASIG